MCTFWAMLSWFMCLEASVIMSPSQLREVFGDARALGMCTWIIAIVRRTAQDVVELPVKNSSCLFSDIKYASIFCEEIMQL